MGRLRVVTFKIDEETLDRLDTYAQLVGMHRSEVIRRAIDMYLRVEERKVRPQPRIVKLNS